MAAATKGGDPAMEAAQDQQEGQPEEQAADSNEVPFSQDQQEGQPEEQAADSNEVPFSQRVIEAADNLAPNEVVPPGKVGAVLGVLLHAHDNNGELPGPLHERFPDHYPSPDNE